MLEDRTSSQEMELEWETQYGKQNVRNSKGKQRILELIGAGGQDEFAENGLRMGLSMESKM